MKKSDVFKTLITLLLLSVTTPPAFSIETNGPEFEQSEDVSVLDIPGSKSSKEKTGGWLEYRYGQRISSHNAISRSQTMNEFRLQIEKVKDLNDYEGHIRLDLLGDMVLDRNEIDVRELYMKLPTPDWMSASIGRQIIMWGTGDVIFVNDLFPKDFNSFFMGRDAEAEYMKSSSDALKLNFYSMFGDFDVVYIPRFRPYVVPVGKRFSYYNPIAGSIVGDNEELRTEDRDEWFNDDVWTLRYSYNIKGNELSIYGYDGYWPVPNGFLSSGKAYYPELRSLGFSLRGGAFSGIWSVESAYYDSLEDTGGDNPFIPNSQLRWYVGYDHELVKDLHLGLQYYNERRRHQDEYESTLPPGFVAKNQDYRMWTMRLTQFLLHQNLTLSLFIYYSPTEKDYYLRTNVFYKYSDKWSIHFGTNQFEGDRDDTLWGQYRENNNAFFGVRYNFN